MVLSHSLSIINENAENCLLFLSKFIVHDLNLSIQKNFFLQIVPNFLPRHNLHLQFITEHAEHTEHTDYTEYTESMFPCICEINILRFLRYLREKNMRSTIFRRKPAF